MNSAGKRLARKDLPPYIVRESPRAKRILVKYTDKEGLVVVIPKGTNRNVIPPILNKNHEVIEKILSEKQRSVRKAHEEGLFTPSRINFPAIGQRWSIIYKDTPAYKITCREQPGSILEIEGPEREYRVVGNLLRKWLREKARHCLTPIMEEEARRCGLSFTKLQFRIQKTRWGSRSSTGTISLNASLLFLESPLVRHVMIHELCHTVHMNHSGDFWALVTRWDRDWENHRNILRHSFRSVPPWVRDI